MYDFEFYRTRFKFENNIRELRKEKGISQGKLADIVGLSRNALASIERCEAEPSFRKAYAISRYFGKSVEDVFTVKYAESNEKVYKLIVILNNADPHTEAFYTFANMTLDRAMGIFLEENPGAEGVVLVHQNGVFSYLDRVEKLNKGVYNA